MYNTHTHTHTAFPSFCLVEVIKKSLMWVLFRESHFGILSTSCSINRWHCIIFGAHHRHGLFLLLFLTQLFKSCWQMALNNWEIRKWQMNSFGPSPSIQQSFHQFNGCINGKHIWLPVFLAPNFETCLICFWWSLVSFTNKWDEYLLLQFRHHFNVCMIIKYQFNSNNSS